MRKRRPENRSGNYEGGGGEEKNSCERWRTAGQRGLGPASTERIVQSIHQMEVFTTIQRKDQFAYFKAESKKGEMASSIIMTKQRGPWSKSTFRTAPSNIMKDSKAARGMLGP